MESGAEPTNRRRACRASAWPDLGRPADLRDCQRPGEAGCAGQEGDAAGLRWRGCGRGEVAGAPAGGVSASPSRAMASSAPWAPRSTPTGVNRLSARAASSGSSVCHGPSGRCTTIATFDRARRNLGTLHPLHEAPHGACAPACNQPRPPPSTRATPSSAPPRTAGSTRIRPACSTTTRGSCRATACRSTAWRRSSWARPSRRRTRTSRATACCVARAGPKVRCCPRTRSRSIWSGSSARACASAGRSGTTPRSSGPGIAWLELDADFADIAEVGRERRQKRRPQRRGPRPQPRAPVPRSARRAPVRSGRPRPRSGGEGRAGDDVGRVWRPPRARAARGVVLRGPGELARRRAAGDRPSARNRPMAGRLGSEHRWRTRRLRIDAPDRLRVPFERAIEDLYSLRNADLEHDLLDGQGPLPPLRRRGWILNAGVPTFTGYFGRDTLTAGWQSAMVGTDALHGALEVAASTQASTDDPWRDAEPGKMLHELRRGPLAMLGLSPRDAYYGSQTTPAIFVLAVSELWHWTGNDSLLRRFRDPALRAIEWSERACAARRRVPDVRAAVAGGPAEPGLEGLRRGDPPCGRPDRRATDRDRRGAGVPLPRPAADGRDPRRARAARASRRVPRPRCRASGALAPGVLDAARGLLRARARCRRRPGRFDHVEPRSCARRRHGPDECRSPGCRPAAVPCPVQRLGRPNPRGRPPVVQPAGLPPRDGMAGRERDVCARVQALRPR